MINVGKESPSNGLEANDGNEGDPRPSLIRIQQVDEFIDKAPPEPKHMIEGLILAGSIVQIAGPPGVGKSHLVNEVSVAIAKGRPAFGKFPTRKGKVLIVEVEHGHYYLAKRFCMAGMKDASSEKLPLYVAHGERIQLDRKEDLKTFIDLLKKEKFEVVILDPFPRFHSQDENDAKAMGGVMNALAKIQKECPGITIVLVSHTGKEAWKKNTRARHGSARGSSVVMCAVDADFELMRVGKRTRDFLKLKLTCHKQKDAPELSIMINLHISETGTDWKVIKILDDAEGDEEEAADEKATLKKKILAAFKRSGSGFFNTVEEIREAAGGNNGSVGKVLKQLVEDGSVLGGRGKGYRLASSETAANEDEES